jgi:hypothetical protein
MGLFIIHSARSSLQLLAPIGYVAAPIAAVLIRSFFILMYKPARVREITTYVCSVAPCVLFAW